MTKPTNPTCRFRALRRTRSIAAAAVVLGLTALALAAGGCQSDGAKTAQRRKTSAQARRSTEPGTHPKVAAAKTDRAKAYRDRAEALYGQGDPKAALEAVRCARRIDPWDVLACQMEARLALDLGHHEDYRNALRAVLAASPRSAPLHNAVGELLVDDGDVQGGLAALERAAALDPANAEYASNLASVCIAADLPVAAEHALKSGLARNPGDEPLLAALGEFYESRAAWAAAAQTYETLLAADSDNKRWLSHRDCCLEHLASRDAAESVFADCNEPAEGSVTPAACEQTVEEDSAPAGFQETRPQDGSAAAGPSEGDLEFEPPIVVEPSSSQTHHSFDWAPRTGWRPVGQEADRDLSLPRRCIQK